MIVSVILRLYLYAVFYEEYIFVLASVRACMLRACMKGLNIACHA